MAQKRWPFALSWHRGLWRHWDELRPAQRAAFEKSYEERQTKIGLMAVRGQISRDKGSHRHLLKQRSIG